jgi:glucoamylase
VSDRGAFDRTVPIRNWATDPGLPAWGQIGLDFLHLVRIGLRDARDPLIVDSVAIADAVLKVDTPAGPCWHRYNDDGYGEHEDGTAYDGTGHGRLWPLLTGERGHYELALGNDPLPYLEAMARMASPGGMLPEQIWDSYSIPDSSLEFGRPTGSAMPLAWAHAEYIKLAASRAQGRLFDMPAAVVDRYKKKRPSVTTALWCEHAPISEIPAGSQLSIALKDSGSVHWGINSWTQIKDQPTSERQLGMYFADLAVTTLRVGDLINFTYRNADNRWVGQDFVIRVVSR